MVATLAPKAINDRWIPSACNMCYNSCSILAHVVDDVLIKIEGNPASPVGSGRLCPKGASGMMLLYDPNRLNVPLKRTNPEKGIGIDPGWQEISWEEAMDTIVAKLQALHADDPRKLFNQRTTTVSAQRIQSIFGAAFGSPNQWVAGGGLHCGNGAHLLNGVNHASWSLVPDFEYCNYAIYFGASKGHAAGHVANANAQLAADARSRGMKMVVVDPMCNFSAAKAVEWVPIRVGTDASLALGMVNLLLNEYGLYDEEYLKKGTNAPYLVRPDGHYLRDRETGKPLVWDSNANLPRTYDEDIFDWALEGQYEVEGTTGVPAFQLLKEHVKKYNPQLVEEQTTVPEKTLRKLAWEFGSNARIGSTIVIDGEELPYRPVAAGFFRGAQGHKNSVYNCLAIELLNQVVGASDVVGGALGFCPTCFGSPATGKPRYIPYSGIDGLMNTGTWVVPHPPYPPAEPKKPQTMGLTELFPLGMMSPFMASADQEEVWQKFKLPYRPEMLLNFGANSIMSVGNPETVAETLKKIPFIVSFDIFLNEFSDFADIILPDCCYMERLESGPNYPFLFNHPSGSGQWGWPIRQPVVQPVAQRRDFSQVILDLAYRVGIGDAMNAMLNFTYGIEGEYCLQPDQQYTWEEVVDRRLKSVFGAERGLDWFREHGVYTWPKQVKEVYWRPFVNVRVPIYFEYFKTIGEKTKAIADAHDFAIDYRRYEPLPDWNPCPSHQVQDPQYDLWGFYYRDVLHTNSLTMENPWLDEASLLSPFTYKIALNSETARKKGIKDGDIIWVESDKGRRIKGPVKLTEGIQSQALGIAACAGHWSPYQPVARGKGIFFNELLEIDFEHSDPANLNLDLCVKVKVYRAN